MATTVTKNTVQFWQNKSFVFAVYFSSLLALNIASLVSNRLYVWRIFRNAYTHLIQNSNLYAFYPNEYNDSFLYSPSFPIVFYPFSVLPSLVGYFVWNNLSVLLVPFLIFKMPYLSIQKKALACYIALIEILTCMQGTQSNVMIVALLLLAFISFENKHYWVAAIAMAIGFYIKIFPIVMASIFLLYPNKINFLWKLATVMFILAVSPLLVITPNSLTWQYQNWIAELTLDHKDNHGKISLVGLFQVFTGASETKQLFFQAMGVSVLLLMYIRVKRYANYHYRLLFFSALLIWMVIFNHAAEVASYAIAVVGVALFFAYLRPRKNNRWYIIFFLAVGCVISIDPTPRVISNFMYDHALKTIPYFIVLIIIIYQMIKPTFTFYISDIHAHNADELIANNSHDIRS